jgi:hypothetical protein
MRALLSRPAGRAAVLAAAPELPAGAGRWLARLCQLYDVPFEHLVPDARMLPAESVRFFVIDQNWLDSLVDGALSVAAGAAPEAALLALHRPRLQVLARTALARTAVSSGAGPWTGLLLRSAAVAGWPGLAVTGYGPDPAAGPLPVLRTGTLAPSVLIAIFDGLVRRAEISAPPRGLSFGVELSATAPPRVAVRYTGGAFPPGAQPPDHPSVPVPFRDAGRGVLDVAGLAAAAEAELRRVYAPAAPPPLRAGALGLQLIAAPARRAFTAGPDDG